jgi:hypothetical protein
MPDFGKILIVLGIVIVGVGLFLWSGLGKGWFGQLPGDLAYEGEKVRFYFPIVTCVLLSVVLTFILWLVRRFF